MSTESNLQLIQQMFVDFGKNDIEAAINAFSDNVEYVRPGAPDIPIGGTFKGKEGLMKMFGEINQLLEVKSFVPDSFMADGNKVATMGNDSRARERRYFTKYKACSRNLGRRYECYGDESQIYPGKKPGNSE